MAGICIRATKISFLETSLKKWYIPVVHHRAMQQLPPPDSSVNSPLLEHCAVLTRVLEKRLNLENKKRYYKISLLVDDASCDVTPGKFSYDPNNR